ncbi:outer membrane beta-barrel protein [Catalinimonas niigatensis]|uniref:outer membrane beta-barrel protein n=1 Tax=Catalinimonas niigatensis TaxID=1397264 RepID=UPI0026665BCE|nr:outer membrane beta-barrel protein [Catalinimonas niigatensis]WPP52352.1 outer membrane beta-barrel protein [Catalinimonas niigatensis]
MLQKTSKKAGQMLAGSVLLCCLIVFTCSPSQAQDWSFAVGPGISSYIGDVSEQKLSNPGFTLNAEAWYYLNDNFQLKSGLSFYNLRGNDTDTTRLRSFRANNIEVYTSAMYYFKRGVFTPFAYLGIGFTTNNPMGQSPIGEWDLKNIEPEGEKVPGLVGIVPFGVGLEYEITPVLSLVADLSLRYALSDQLDAVSREIIQVDQLSAEAVEYHQTLSTYIARQVNEEPTIRGGSSSDNDMYGMFTLKVKFTPSTSILGCIDPYKYSRPDRRRKRRNFDPI